MELAEEIATGGKVLAYIVRAAKTPTQTSFITPEEANFQAGFVVYPAGGEIAPHVHRPSERHIVGTSEVLLVRRGRCEVDIYDEGRRLAASRELRAGDVLVLLAGGHGFRMVEDTVFLEIKQGPYLGLDDKERF
jgi:quercetin dioxygenase-like cupin family protein